MKMHIDKIRSLKILSGMLLFLTIGNSCVNEDSGHGNLYLWAPIVEIKKGDNEATLLLTDPRPFTEYIGPGPINPDYFNIWISDDSKDFIVYKKVEVSTNTVPIENLVNGKSYYFLVTGHKGNLDPIKSDTVMTIPSVAQNKEVYIPNIDFSIERLSTSYDLSYLSFTSNNLGGNYGDNLYYRNNTSGSITLLGSDTQGEGWSTTMNKLVYLTNTQEGNTIYPFALRLFDPESKLSTTLLETPYNNYYVSNPTFSPNGEIIFFLSSENNSQKYIYDLWTINPIRKEKTRITNFENIGLFMDGHYGLSLSGEELYMDGRRDISKYKIAIFKLNISTKIFTPVIESPWNDRTPTLSPNNKKIAFISDRSGRDELWMYDLVTLKYSQVTGESPFRFDSRYTNLQWLDNDQMLITVFEGEKSIALKVDID